MLPAVFLAVHLGAGAGIVWEAVRGLRPARPEPTYVPAAEPQGRAA